MRRKPQTGGLRLGKLPLINGISRQNNPSVTACGRDTSL